MIIWQSILATIPTAILAAAVAIAAAWATVFFQNRSITRNVRKAIILEITSIVSNIERTLSVYDQNEAIECKVALLRTLVTPVYTNNAQNIPLLDKESSESIFEFYSSFLSISESAEPKKFLKKDLLELTNIAKKLVVLY